jgi:ABC-type uncharacterized transport system ATPase subunit
LTDSDGSSICYNRAIIGVESNRSAMALLEIQNVTRRFGTFTAVDQVSIAIEAGEFFTLLGPSGCGKTHCCADRRIRSSR